MKNYCTVPTFSLRLNLVSTKQEVPKSITFIGESYFCDSNNIFSGFKSLYLNFNC